VRRSGRARPRWTRGGGSDTVRAVLFSVVLATFNRRDALSRAIDSVLGQQDVELELIVVNDGSTDGTASFLERVRDPRVTVVNQKNGGLGAARNAGIARVSGEWVTFLDDDDMGLPRWLRSLQDLMDDDTCIVCCGGEYRTRDGVHVSTVMPGPMGPLYEDQIGSRIAGTFAVRSDLLRAVGGYDERMTCAHQSELLMRLIPPMLSCRLRMRATNEVLVICESRPATDRPMSSPAALYNGTRLLLEKHRNKISRHPRNFAVYNGIVGVSAARLGLWPEARSAFFAAARAEPLRPHHWLRFSAAVYPPIGRRVWNASSYRVEAR
jgi:glycosyltransferase involved in cell wall biosynthesis